MRKLNLSKSEANKSPQRTKSFLAMLVLALGLFLGMAEVGNAQPGGSCETGYTMQSSTVVVGGCTIKFWACVKCDPSGYTDNTCIIKGWEILGTCSSPPTSAAILAACIAEAKIMYMKGTGGWCSSYYPPTCDQTPPPNHYYYTQQIYICWQKIWRNGKSYTWNCDGAYCQTTWEVCFDANLGTYRFTPYYGPALSGTANCSSTTEPAERDSNNTEDTYCYKIPTGCN